MGKSSDFVLKTVFRKALQFFFFLKIATKRDKLNAMAMLQDHLISCYDFLKDDFSTQYILSSHLWFIFSVWMLCVGKYTLSSDPCTKERWTFTQDWWRSTRTYQAGGFTCCLWFHWHYLLYFACSCCMRFKCHGGDSFSLQVSL